MIKKIIFAAILLCLFIAVPLAVLGYEKVSLGPAFLGFMKNVNTQLNDFKIAIPDIPMIPHAAPAPEAGNFLEALVGILNVLIDFVNLFVRLINVFSMVINLVIQVIQVIVLIIVNLINFKDSIVPIV